MLFGIEQGEEEGHDEPGDEDTDDYESDHGKFVCYINGRTVYYEQLCTDSLALHKS